MNQPSTHPSTSVRWSHVALNCRDLVATARFYTKWFGFTRSRSFGSDDQKIQFLRLGGVYLELFSGKSVDSVHPFATSKDGSQRPGIARHIAFQVDNVDEFLARMGDEAVVTLGPMSFDESIPGWRTAWISDPDGVIVEVSQGYRDN